MVLVFSSILIAEVVEADSCHKSRSTSICMFLNSKVTEGEE